MDCIWAVVRSIFGFAVLHNGMANIRDTHRRVAFSTLPSESEREASYPP